MKANVNSYCLVAAGSDNHNKLTTIAFVVLKQETRVIFYNILVLSLFDDGDIVWANKNNTTVMEHLQILQNIWLSLGVNFIAV